MDVKVKISDEIAATMDERGIRIEDVQQAVAFGEETGKKLYIEGEDHFLARQRLGNFSVYAEYVMSADEAEVLNVYSHMSKLTADDE